MTEEIKDVKRVAYVPVYRWDVKGRRVFGPGVDVKVSAAPSWEKLGAKLDGYKSVKSWRESGRKK